MAQELEVGVHGEAELIEIATRLACEGYWEDIKQVMGVSRVFRYDEQLWDAMKDEPGGAEWKRTRLMYAAYASDLERVRFLLDRGARVNKGCVSDGMTALMWASLEGHLEVVRELCDRGGDVNIVTTDDGFTASMWASQEGHLEVVRELCQRGANANASCNAGGMADDGLTALMWASE